MGKGGLTSRKLFINAGVGVGTVVQASGTLSSETRAIGLDKLLILALRNLRFPDYIKL